ncbi:MAG: sulfite exporter TauE/SafE family protein [Deltaproteobacteria bacterium]|nr:sulfite exporter TauE/SafE family protein [Deltaproteobacteria bacterium]
MDSPVLLATLFAATACLYAMVGFGGGSMYLALLALVGTAYTAIPQIALLCNIVVVIGGCYHLAQAGELRAVRSLWPLFLASVPAAFLGGRLPIGKTVFSILLGIALAVAGLRLLLAGRSDPATRPSRTIPRGLLALLGVGIGLYAGLIGIGGGIFLAPLLYLIGWGRPRRIAAAASGFILINSLAGLAGQLAKTGWGVEPIQLAGLLLAVFLGGQCGSRLLAYRMPSHRLQQCTAVFLIVVAGKLLWRALAV